MVKLESKAWNKETQSVEASRLAMAASHTEAHPEHGAAQEKPG